MRLIDADALMPLFMKKANTMKDRHGVKLGEEWLLNYNDIKDVIDNAPTVDTYTEPADKDRRGSMRLIDADALKEFINECKVCDICPNKKPNCVIHCDFPDYLTPIWEKVIDSIPTIDDLSEYSDKLWQKAYERGKAEARPQGKWIEHWSENLQKMGFRQCSKCKAGYQLYEHGTRKSDLPWIDGQQYTLKRIGKFCPNCGADMRGGRE